MAYARSVLMVLGSVPSLSVVVPYAHADSSVCEILARSIKPDIISQGSHNQQFSEVKKLVSDNTYDEFSNAHSASFDGTLLSDYVDIFVNSKSNESNWHVHRQQFLSMTSETAFSSATSTLQISKFNENIIKTLVSCPPTDGMTALLTQVSDRRDSFTVLLTNKTGGDPSWKLTSFSPQPPDSAFKCDNGFELASLKSKITLGTNSVAFACRKSPNTHFLIAVQTTAGAAKDSFTLESFHEELQPIKDDADTRIQALTDRLDKRGEVVAFAASICPTPWVPYQPAAGRFIRGLDPTGTIDPDGATRQVGGLQPDGIGSHAHTMGVNGGDSTTMVPGGATQRMPNFTGDAYGGGSKKQTDENTGAVVETRPKNVDPFSAFCNKSMVYTIQGRGTEYC